MKNAIIFAAFLLLFLFALNTPAEVPGSLDSLNAKVVGPTVMSAVMQPDGKLVIAGAFTSVLGVPRGNIARLNRDGSLDTAFDPFADDTVFCVAVQGDGKILLGGFFTTLKPNGAIGATSRSRIARLNSDGTIDPSFDPNANSSVFNITLQTDGQIVIGGAFTTLQPNGAATATSRRNIARLNANGSLDVNFDPRASNTVFSVVIQTDGKIVMSGFFSSLQPNGAVTATTRRNIARVNADGSLDMSFDPNGNGLILCMALQADGKIIIGGQFTTLRPNGAVTAIARQRSARLNVDGSVDVAFDPNANGSVESIAIQADGKILLGGGFSSLRPNGATTAITRNKIARFNADGSLDTVFDPNADSGVRSVAVQQDGKILLGGFFNTLQPNGATNAPPRNFFARLNNDTATQTLRIPSVTHIQWERGGASPDLSHVIFEHSVDGGSSWTLLGNAIRTGSTASWDLSGLTLPASGLIRARGRVNGGTYNGSSGLVETELSYPVEIAVVGPDGTLLEEGDGGVKFGDIAIGSSSDAKLFTVRNTGTSILTINSITKLGANSNDFTLDIPNMPTTIAPGSTTTFSAVFAPVGPVSSDRVAEIQITCNVNGSKNPYDLVLSGTGLSTVADTDGDGLSDWAESQYVSFGFDWRTNQSADVNLLFSNLSKALPNVNAAGFYSPSQVQAINIGIPLIQKNPATGEFTVTFGLEKSSNLSSFNLFPIAAPQTSVTPEGKLEIRFSVPDHTAFFRLQAQ